MRGRYPRVWFASPSYFVQIALRVLKNLPANQETWVQSLGEEDPLEKEMATHSSILAWESHGQRSLMADSSWGHKQSDTTE